MTESGIAAMINGTVDIANASRQMKQKEIDQAKTRGQDPVEHIVGYDALAVYLHPDNPLDSVSIAQLAEVYGEEGRDRELKAVQALVFLGGISAIIRRRRGIRS